MRSRLSVLLVAGFALGAAACGGGDTQGRQEPTPSEVQAQVSKLRLEVENLRLELQSLRDRVDAVAPTTTTTVQA